jgi:hypothetical protein
MVEEKSLSMAQDITLQIIKYSLPLKLRVQRTVHHLPLQQVLLPPARRTNLSRRHASSEGAHNRRPFFMDKLPEDTPFYDPFTDVRQTTLATRTKSSTPGGFTASATEKSPREIGESLFGTTSNDKAQIIALEKDEPKNLAEMQVPASRPDVQLPARLHD